MKKDCGFIIICLWAFCHGTLSVFGDTVILFNNSTISGTVVQTNGDSILVLADYAAFNFSLASIKAIKTDPPPEFLNSGRLPNFKNVILYLSRQSWATNLAPIAATVIDKGVLRNIPYSSFRCGEDYEVNIYGDLDNPAGIEIGIYHKLLESNAAKSNCMDFITGLLGQPTDKEFLQSLNLGKDLKTRDGLTFEISPPTEEDSYNGWWISIYSEEKLSQARASDKELGEISITKADAIKETNQVNDISSWTTEEMKSARPTTWPKITFVTKSGILISNADVVHINDGVSLVWEKDNGSSGGLVRLEDLPAELQSEFSYDAKKTADADALAQQKREQWNEAVASSATQAAAQSTPAQYSDFGISSSYSDEYSGGGRVYVHGYYRSNGTYVNAYTRSSPHRR